MARYIKIQSNGHNYGCWVEIYEIEFNKTAPEFDESAVNLASGTLEGNLMLFMMKIYQQHMKLNQ